MQATIKLGHISGAINVPASKSMMQRACAGALLHSGRTVIHNPGHSDDEEAAMQIISQLGATIQHSGNELIIESKGLRIDTAAINCGESGLATRLFLPIIALANQAITITGRGTLLKRPMDTMVSLLPRLGIHVNSNNGHLPLHIHGPLQPGDITIDGSGSSQYLTGLLFAYAFSVDAPATIFVNDLNSKPYIDLTLQVLAGFGKIITHDNYNAFRIDPATFIHKADVEINIEADWSSAAFWLVAGAINGDVTLHNLETASTQADKAILNILQQQCGAYIYTDDEKIKVAKTNDLQPFQFDATDAPDLFPVLSVLAAYCKGTSHIKGIHRLVHKESNRIDSITGMLRSFGVEYAMSTDTLVVVGGGILTGGVVDSHHDHRIAMAAAIAAIGASGDTTIHSADAVSKSYPDFFKHLSSAGAVVSIT